MMDYINKKINFTNSKKNLKIIKKISSVEPNQVYLCNDIEDKNINYCLKIITSKNEDKAILSTIKMEIYMLLIMKNSEYSIQMIDYFTLDNGKITTCFILLEYFPKGTLKDFLKKMTNEKIILNEFQIWKIIYNISLSIQKIHKLNYAHRDIVPENILIDDNFNKIKLCDFGSCTNKFYDNFSNVSRSEIVFDKTKGKNLHFQAPELLDLYSNYPISEKVDIWSLGIIMYSLMFDFLPFSNEIKFITGKNLFLNDEMEKCYSSKLIDLLKKMIVQNPSQRFSINDVIQYINSNFNLVKSNQIDLKKLSISLSQKISDMNAYLFKRHSTQFWVLKLIDNKDIESYPKFKYLKLVINKAWKKKEKIIKFYQSISDAPIHYFSITALKSLYIIHFYIFLGPRETLFPKDLVLDDFINFFYEVWSTRFNNKIYENEDNFNDIDITKFILLYCEFIKLKLNFHKKYSFFENNFALIKDFKNFLLLIDKNFIIDLLSFFSQICQYFSQIPFNIKQLNQTIDVISHIFNLELVSIFSFLFYILIAYKNYNIRKLDYSQILIYDSYFFEISKNVNIQINNLRNYRQTIKSDKEVIFLSQKYKNIDLFKIYINNLNEYLKNNSTNFTENNIKEIFSKNEIYGISLPINIGNLIFKDKLEEYFTTRGSLKQEKKTESQIQSLINQMNKELKLVDSKINYNFQLNSNISNNTNSNSSLNNFNQNFFPQNNSSTSSIDSLGSTIYPEIYKDKINKNQQNQNSKSSNSQNEKYESVNSNISIFNIVHNYNNYNVNQPLTTEKIAKNFLIELFQKPHPQWKINSNSIKILNNNPIGIGGSSEVYLGNYRGTEVAIKKLKISEFTEKNIKEFEREVSSLLMLRHPNLVLFMGAITELNNISIVTEYCSGGNLFDLLYRKKNIFLSWNLRIKILLEISIGMNFLHTNNPPIIHRDLKSLNILLTEKINKSTDSTKIKISDFGLSKILKSLDLNNNMTGQLGTCHWMAPEVIENKDYTIKADVYSFGILIFEICSRQIPYFGMNLQQIQYFVTVKKGRPDINLIEKNVPIGLVNLMIKCWDENYNNRPSFSQIIEFLKNIVL